MTNTSMKDGWVDRLNQKLLNNIREWSRACRTYGGEEKCKHRVLVEKPEAKRPLGRSGHRWQDNIKMYLQELGCGDKDWIELARDRDRWWTLVNAVMNLQVP